MNVQVNLKPSVQYAEIAAKANACSKFIVKSFLSRDAAIVIRAFTFYVRPILEYFKPVWSSHNIGDVNAIENFKRIYTHNIHRACHLPNAPNDERQSF